MKMAIMQPYFFPYLGYFQLIKAVDKYILYDNLNYIKNGWINRNRLLEINKNPVYVTVPIQQKSSFFKIKELEIDNTQPWRRKLLKFLNHNYKRSAYYQETYPLIENIINCDEKYLSELNIRSIKLLCAYLDIRVDFNYDIQSYEKLEKELSNPEQNSNSPSNIMTTRILKLCRHEKATTYVNAIGGRELYSKETFAQAGIELYFLKSLPYSYQQNSNQFFEHLSIIDVLMNCGRAETKRMLDKYELV